MEYLSSLIGDKMLNAINMKILFAILAALAAIGGALAYQRHETETAAAAAQKATAILQQQQKDADEQKKRAEAFRQQVEKNRKQHNSAAAREGKTWKSYIP
jgi:predicted negative regulator of RcsB-dependent stress response